MSFVFVASLAGVLLGWLMGFLSVFLILLVLIQRGRGGGLTGALGGPGGQSAFGSKAGDTFTVITVAVAAIWGFVCAFTMWLLGTHTPPTLAEPPAVTSPVDEDFDLGDGLTIPIDDESSNGDGSSISGESSIGDAATLGELGDEMGLAEDGEEATSGGSDVQLVPAETSGVEDGSATSSPTGPDENAASSAGADDGVEDGDTESDQP